MFLGVFKLDMLWPYIYAGLPISAVLFIAVFFINRGKAVDEKPSFGIYVVI